RTHRNGEPAALPPALGPAGPEGRAAGPEFDASRGSGDGVRPHNHRQLGAGTRHGARPAGGPVPPAGAGAGARRAGNGRRRPRGAYRMALNRPPLQVGRLKGLVISFFVLLPLSGSMYGFARFGNQAPVWPGQPADPPPRGAILARDGSALAAGPVTNRRYPQSLASQIVGF